MLVQVLVKRLFTKKESSRSSRHNGETKPLQDYKQRLESAARMIDHRKQRATTDRRWHTTLLACLGSALVMARVSLLVGTLALTIQLFFSVDQEDRPRNPVR